MIRAMDIVSSVHADMMLCRCCRGLSVDCLSNGHGYHPGSAYVHMIVAGQSPRVSCSAWDDGATSQTNRRRSPIPAGIEQGTTKAPCCGLCDKAAVYGLLNGAIIKESMCSDIAYVYASDSQLLSVHRCHPAC